MSGLIYTSRCRNNGLIIFDALAPDDLQTGRRLYSDVTDHTSLINRVGYCTRYEVQNLAQLRAYLTSVLNECRFGILRPILHFECHGHPDKGMQIGAAGEFLAWEELQKLVGSINQVTRHHCAVVIAACYGHAISEGLQVNKPSPFNFLVAPKQEMQAGTFQDTMTNFYRTIASDGDLRGAFEAMPSEMHLLITGEWFYRNVGSYMVRTDSRKVRQKITEQVVSLQMEKPSGNRAQRRNYLHLARQSAKKKVNDTEGFVQNCANIFFHGDPPVDMQDFRSWVATGRRLLNR